MSALIVIEQDESANTTKIEEKKYELSSIQNECLLYGKVSNTHCCYFAVEYKGAFITHGDHLRETIILFCSFESDISFVCIDSDEFANINGINLL
jgi:hypothetical protein